MRSLFFCGGTVAAIKLENPKKQGVLSDTHLKEDPKAALNIRLEQLEKQIELNDKELREVGEKVVNFLNSCAIEDDDCPYARDVNNRYNRLMMAKVQLDDEVQKCLQHIKFKCDDKLFLPDTFWETCEPCKVFQTKCQDTDAPLQNAYCEKRTAFQKEAVEAADQWNTQAQYKLGHDFTSVSEALGKYNQLPCTDDRSCLVKSQRIIEIVDRAKTVCDTHASEHLPEVAAALRNSKLKALPGFCTEKRPEAESLAKNQLDQMQKLKLCYWKEAHLFVRESLNNFKDLTKLIEASRGLFGKSFTHNVATFRAENADTSAEDGVGLTYYKTTENGDDIFDHDTFTNKEWEQAFLINKIQLRLAGTCLALAKNEYSTLFTDFLESNKILRQSSDRKVEFPYNPALIQGLLTLLRTNSNKDARGDQAFCTSWSREAYVTGILKPREAFWDTLANQDQHKFAPKLTECPKRGTRF